MTSFFAHKFSPLGSFFKALQPNTGRNACATKKIKKTQMPKQSRRTRTTLFAAILALYLLHATHAAATPGQHTLEVTLNYDFSTDNACSATLAKGCVQQFNIYDL